MSRGTQRGASLLVDAAETGLPFGDCPPSSDGGGDPAGSGGRERGSRFPVAGTLLSRALRFLGT